MMDLTLQPDEAEIARASEWAVSIARRAELPANLVFALELCIEEAISNIIRYGGDHDSGFGIRLDVATKPGGVVIVIEDAGREFDPTTMPPPKAAASIEETPIGGRGVGLMRRFAQRIRYERSGGRNRLTLGFGAV